MSKRDRLSKYTEMDYGHHMYIIQAVKYQEEIFRGIFQVWKAWLHHAAKIKYDERVTKALIQVWGAMKKI